MLNRKTLDRPDVWPRSSSALLHCSSFWRPAAFSSGQFPPSPSRLASVVSHFVSCQVVEAGSWYILDTSRNSSFSCFHPSQLKRHGRPGLQSQGSFNTSAAYSTTYTKLGRGTSGNFTAHGCRLPFVMCARKGNLLSLPLLF